MTFLPAKVVHRPSYQTIIPTVLFGIAFAFIESSVVVYLRQLPSSQSFPAHPQILLNLIVINFISQNSHLIGNSFILRTEMIREFSTLLVLASFAYIAGSDLKHKLGIFLMSFSIWDIFYYIFLKLLLNWPASVFNLDVFFLLPVPSVGPVLTALLFSAVLLLIGFRLLFFT